ncbi:hypothetical protein CV093_04485 [Oceanobacillus sp. 143]|nr:hypothetical protein CV093_04485 [Oceanobacillus sp. 143]
MFQAAVDDAKAALNLPNDLVLKLLEDPINRNEVFRWVLEGIPEKVDQSKLNLEPYIESYNQYQDLIRPFFELIALSINDYKDKHWDPEFLELLNKVDILTDITERGFNEVIEKQTTLEQLSKESIKYTEENNRYLKEVITPTEYNDLNELIKKVI